MTRGGGFLFKTNSWKGGSYISSIFRAAIGGMCEICNVNISTEVHHLQHQVYANADNGYIDSFHKNHPANLINICEECHNKIHRSGTQQKIVKTSEGHIITDI